MLPLRGHWETLPYIHNKEILLEANDILDNAEKKSNQEDIITIIAGDGTKKAENIPTSKSTYLNVFDTVLQPICEGTRYPRF